MSILPFSQFTLSLIPLLVLEQNHWGREEQRNVLPLTQPTVSRRSTDNITNLSLLLLLERIVNTGCHESLSHHKLKCTNTVVQHCILYHTP